MVASPDRLDRMDISVDCHDCLHKSITLFKGLQAVFIIMNHPLLLDVTSNGIDPNHDYIAYCIE